MRLVVNEDTLQMYVKDLMDSPRADPRVVWFHVPNEGKASIRHRVNMKKRGVLAGVSDCVFLLPIEWRWRYLCLELKNGTKGRLRVAQAFFRHRVNAIGGAYEIARTPQEVDAVLKAFGIVTAPALRLARAA